MTDLEFELRRVRIENQWRRKWEEDMLEEIADLRARLEASCRIGLDMVETMREMGEEVSITPVDCILES